jgi:hypothetical protein
VFPTSAINDLPKSETSDLGAGRGEFAFNETVAHAHLVSKLRR